MAPKRETALEAWGKELAHACEAAGMTGKQLASALNFAPATLSQWMNGKRTPHPEDVRRCDEKLGTNGYLGRYFEKWVTHEIPTVWQEKWLTAEASANMVQCYELSVIPGLLQTENYARAVIQLDRHSPITVEERVHRRMERQVILADENPTMCIFVIDEFALRRPIGGREVMAEQLKRLLDLMEQPNIVIKIVPSGAEYYAGTPFMIARLNGVEIVNLDDPLKGRVVEASHQVAEINKIWEDIREAAVSSSDSRKLIEKAMNEWEA